MTIDTDRAAKLILMLSSDADGEVLNAARMLKKMGLHEIAELIRHGGGPGITVHHFHVGDVPPQHFGFDINLGEMFGARPWTRDDSVSARGAKATRKRAKAELIKQQVEDVVQLFVDTAPGIAVGDLDHKSIQRFIKKLGIDLVKGAVTTACARVDPESAFRYFCGICWREIREREDQETT